jgi:Berberine and berberine like
VSCRAFKFYHLRFEADSHCNWTSLVGGNAVSKVDPSSTGLNPAWRSALVLANFGESWDDGMPLDEIREKREHLKANIRALEELVPGGGSYFNEVRDFSPIRCFSFLSLFSFHFENLMLTDTYQASLYEENPRQTFFGSHYDRLKEIKDVYDPVGMFIVAEGVGSEEWDESLNCRV